MLALLKQKSQLRLVQKPRKKYEALIPAKRIKPNPGADVIMARAEEAKEGLN